MNAISFVQDICDSLWDVRYAILPANDDVALLVISQMLCFICLLLILAKMGQGNTQSG